MHEVFEILLKSMVPQTNNCSSYNYKLKNKMLSFKFNWRLLAFETGLRQELHGIS
jgi:hypothetical protein